MNWFYWTLFRGSLVLGLTLGNVTKFKAFPNSQVLNGMQPQLMDTKIKLEDYSSLIKCGGQCGLTKNCQGFYFDSNKCKLMIEAEKVWSSRALVPGSLTIYLPSNVYEVEGKKNFITCYYWFNSLFVFVACCRVWKWWSLLFNQRPGQHPLHNQLHGMLWHLQDNSQLHSFWPLDPGQGLVLSEKGHTRHQSWFWPQGLSRLYGLQFAKILS